MNKILEIKNLKKNYGELTAVKGIDFYVEEGKLFAFLGPNGAGKSTTINILCTLLQKDEGEVIVNGSTLGKDHQEIRRQIGVVFQESLLDPLLTVKENIITRGSFYGLSKAKIKQATKRVAKATGIAEFINRPYGKLSGGQRRRADIARALVNTPKILFLDEPTTGLDPQTRQHIWETIRQLQKQYNMTVFLTTHYMEEAANADYIIIIDNGEIAVKGTPGDLCMRYSSDTLRLKTADKKGLATLLDKQDYSIKNDVFSIKLKNTTDALPILNKCEDLISNVEIINGTMDDVFINITGKEIRE